MEEIQSVWFEHAEFEVLYGTPAEKSRNTLDKNAHLQFRREAWARTIDLGVINMDVGIEVMGVNEEAE